MKLLKKRAKKVKTQEVESIFGKYNSLNNFERHEEALTDGFSLVRVFYFDSKEKTLYEYVSPMKNGEFTSYEGKPAEFRKFEKDEEGKVKATAINTEDSSSKDTIEKLQKMAEIDIRYEKRQAKEWDSLGVDVTKHRKIEEPSVVEDDYIENFNKNRKFEMKKRALDECYNRIDAYYYDEKQDTLFHAAIPLLGNKYHDFLSFGPEFSIIKQLGNGKYEKTQISDVNAELEEAFHTLIAFENGAKEEREDVWAQKSELNI